MKKPATPTCRETTYLGLSVKETVKVQKVTICELDPITYKKLSPLNTKKTLNYITYAKLASLFKHNRSDFIKGI